MSYFDSKRKIIFVFWQFLRNNPSGGFCVTNEFDFDVADNVFGKPKTKQPVFFEIIK